MSGDHCNREGNLQNSDEAAVPKLIVSSLPAPSKSHSSGSSAGASGLRKKEANAIRDANAGNGNFSAVPKKGLHLLRNEILNSAEFNKTIATWFGEKGFIAMRSFFRASVLNSLQKDPIGLNQANCTDLDAAIVTLIADYLVKNGKYFTLSVFSNEVLRPLVSSYPVLNKVMQRVGKSEEVGEPTLTQEIVSFVVRTLNVQTYSILGAGILHKYLEDHSGDLLSVLMGLLRDNGPNLNIKEPAVRDHDVVAAFSEGLQEEMGKFRCWFSNFNSQFVDVSGKLKKLICSQTTEDGVRPKNLHGGQDEQELWNQMVRMDEHLKKQQECLMKMRDKERKKLATYAKELEYLHQEMNMKLKSIQDYEKTLKMREKALREREEVGVASVEHRGRGDHRMVETLPKKWAVIDDITQRFDRHMLLEAGLVSAEMADQIIQENLELKATLREQNLRIEALTKKAVLLSAGSRSAERAASCMPDVYGDTVTSNSARHSSANLLPTRQPAFQVLPSKQLHAMQFRKPFSLEGSLVSAMSSSLRKARMEIEYLRDQQNTTDLQYDRLLHNKLLKRL